MNEEIYYITSKGKMAKNDWENDSDFLPALYIAWKMLRQFCFHILLANLIKQRHIISSVTSYKKL